MKIRSEVAAFAEKMEDTLRINDHKGGWKHLSDLYLVRRLEEEVGELENALETGAPPEVVAKEAADVANFAMMIADTRGRLNKRADAPMVRILVDGKDVFAPEGRYPMDSLRYFAEIGADKGLVELTDKVECGDWVDIKGGEVFVSYPRGAWV